MNMQDTDTNAVHNQFASAVIMANGTPFTVPNALYNALMLAADLEGEREALTGLVKVLEWQLDVDAPKVEFYDDMADTLAKMAGEHFNKPYKYTTHKMIGGLTRELGELLKHDNIKRNIDSVEYTVFRRKHGLAHGVRQSFFVADIVDACAVIKKSSSANQAVKKMVDWMNTKKENDPNFIKKLQFTAVFLRSGRESEVSSRASSYHIYIERDAENFLSAASGKGNPFDNDNERKLYADSILGRKQNISPDANEDLRSLSRILRAAHTLDLRRMMHFNEDRVKTATAKLLFDDPAVLIDYDVTTLINKLWNRSGEYLAAVGDTDLVKQAGVKYKNIADAYDDKFFVLSNNPEKLIDVLYAARSASIITF